MIIELSIPSMSYVYKQMQGFEDKAELAMARAINRTIDHVNSLIVAQSKEKYVVKAGQVKKTLSIRKAKRSQLSGQVISYADKKVPLIGFKVSPSKPQHIDPPTEYQSKLLKKGKGLKGLTGSADRSKAFVAEMDSGHVGVFQRMTGVGNGRKIAELYGLAIPSMISSERISKEVQTKGATFLRERLDTEIDLIMRRIR